MDVQLTDKRTIFERALDFASGAEREAYLEDACAGKPEMRAQVDSLLKAHNDVGSFLDGPAFDAQRTGPMEPIAEQPGTIIGPYKLLEQIGEGGFGVVFMAEQESPIRRRVALKVIKPGMDSRQVIARFEAERQALALMDHPNIAHVLDAGATDSGRPYFVMELVRGIPITDFCDQNRLAVDERLKLFATVCHAVQHAHQKGIIHRDIKPTNVLVTLHDGEPVAKVIDFGVAKATGQRLTDKTLFTAFAQMIGTPLYMSPEQTEMSGLDVDTRSDIYSLGVMLYELLTGTTPLDKERLQQAAYDEIRRIIREEEPPKPSTRISTLGATATAISTQRKSDPGKLSSLVRGELDWIVMKCLEKDRNRRYETANGLVRDIDRYLNNEAVEACPPSAAYRVRKFVARHRRPVIAATAFVLLLIAATATSAWLFARAETQRRLADSREKTAQEARAEAESERKAAEQARHATEIELQRARLVQVQLELATGDMAKARSLMLLPVHPSLEQEWHWRAWEYARKTRIVNRVDMNPTGEALAPVITAGKGRLIFINGRLFAHVSTNSSDKRELLRLELDTGQDQTTTPFAQDAARDPARYSAVTTIGRAVEIRDRKKSAVVDSFPGTGEDVVSFAFDPGGRQLYGITGDWYVATWLWSPDGCADIDIKDTKAKQARHFQFTSDGRRLVSGGYGDVAEVWDTATHTRVQLVQAGKHPVFAPSGDALLTPDGQTLFTTGWQDPVIRIWRVSDGSLSREIKRDQWVGAGVIRINLKSDGKSLYATNGGGNSAARVERLDVQDGKKLASSAQLSDGAFIYAIALSEKHNRLFACLHPSNQVSDNPEHRRCLILDATTLETAGMLPDAHTAGLRDIHLSPDGNLLALCSRDGTATIWDWQQQRLLHRLEAKPGRAHSNIISSVRFHPTAPVVATACHDNHVIFWSTDTGRPLADINIDEQNKLGYGSLGILKEIAFSPDGKTLVITVKDKLWWLDLICYDQGVASLKAERDGLRRAVGTPPDRPSDSWDQASLSVDRGLAHQVAGRSKEAIADFTRAIELAPDYARAWYLRGLEYQVLEQTEKASYDLDMAITLDFFLNDDAIAELREVVELNPNSAPFFDALGDALFAKGRVDQATAVRKQLIELDPKLFYAHVSRGKILSYEGDQDAAIAEFRTAIEIYPKNSSVQNALAFALNQSAWTLATNPDPKKRDPERAIKLSKEAVELAPKNADYWNTLGVAHYRAGNWNDAISSLQKYRELRTKDAEWGNPFFLAMAHWRLGNKDEARSWYDKGVGWMDTHAATSETHPVEDHGASYRWMDTHAATSETLIRFRVEAAELLGVNEKK